MGWLGITIRFRRTLELNGKLQFLRSIGGEACSRANWILDQAGDIRGASAWISQYDNQGGSGGVTIKITVVIRVQTSSLPGAPLRPWRIRRCENVGAGADQSR